MGLMDLFRSYFPANHKERLGPNDLPRDVLHDLRNGSSDCPHRQYQDRQDHLPRGVYQESFHDVDKEFQNAFHQMDSIFKSFFGSGPSFEYFQGGPESDDKENDMFEGFFGGGPSVFQGESFSDSDDQENNMFKSFFGSRPGFDYFQGGPSIDGKNKSLREKMLDDGNEKQIISPFQDEGDHSERFGFTFHIPFFRNLWQSPFDRKLEDNMVKNEDQDLDKEYESGEHTIDDILKSQNTPNDRPIFGFGENLPNGFSSVFKSSSVTKKVNPDGSIETTSRRRDSDGNEEVVTSRIIGERTHTVTSKKNNAGEEEKIESFINMDEKDLGAFNEKWNEHSQKGPRDMVIAPERDISIKDNLPDLESWWKPKL